MSTNCILERVATTKSTNDDLLARWRAGELIDPIASLNDRKISSRILNSVIGSVSDRLDLGRFENQGIIARLLKLEINPQEVNIAAFIRLNPVNPL